MTDSVHAHLLPHNIEFLLFDFDGTIADSIASAFVAFNRVAPEFHLTPLSEREMHETRSVGLAELFQRGGASSITSLRIARRVIAEMRHDPASIQPVCDMPEVLRGLRERGYRLALVTSNRREVVEDFIAKHGLDCFEVLAAGVDIFGKAHKIRRLIREREVSKNAAAYIGDEVRDIEAARGAGVAVIACAWGFNTEEVLAKAQPDWLAGSPRELLALLPGPSLPPSNA